MGSCQFEPDALLDGAMDVISQTGATPTLKTVANGVLLAPDAELAAREEEEIAPYFTILAPYRPADMTDFSGAADGADLGTGLRYPRRSSGICGRGKADHGSACGASGRRGEMLTTTLNAIPSPSSVGGYFAPAGNLDRGSDYVRGDHDGVAETNADRSPGANRVRACL